MHTETCHLTRALTHQKPGQSALLYGSKSPAEKLGVNIGMLQPAERHRTWGACFFTSLSSANLHIITNSCTTERASDTFFKIISDRFAIFQEKGEFLVSFVMFTVVTSTGLHFSTVARIPYPHFSSSRSIGWVG